MSLTEFVIRAVIITGTATLAGMSLTALAGLAWLACTKGDDQ